MKIMLTLMRYCFVHLIKGIGQMFDNCSFLLTMHEAPLNNSEISNIQDEKIFNEGGTALIPPDNAQENKENSLVNSVNVTPNPSTEVPCSFSLFEVNSLESNLIPPAHVSNEQSESPRHVTGTPYPELDNMDGSLTCLYFNDTLEEVEYMIEEGLKILAKNGCNETAPVTVKPGKRTSNYDYVKSPISRYIKHSPLVPLRRNNNTRENIRLATLDESSNSGENFQNSNMTRTASQPKRYEFPRTAYKTAPHTQIFFENGTQRKNQTKKSKLFKEFKNSPTVTRHCGRLRSTTLSYRRRSIAIEDSFKDFSMDCGDISVHVVKNAKRN